MNAAPKPNQTPSQGGLSRVLAFLLGALFLGAGIYVVTYAVKDNLPGLLAGLGLMLLGGNSMWSGWKRRTSWLSRIGPLP